MLVYRSKRLAYTLSKTLLIIEENDIVPLFKFHAIILALIIFGTLPCFSVTHISLASLCGASANNAKPDQTLQDAASDQVLHCLHTEVFF